MDFGEKTLFGRAKKEQFGLDRGLAILVLDPHIGVWGEAGR